MPLVQTDTGFTGTTNSISTITISASDTTIQGVSYGKDAAGAPLSIPLSTNKMSFQITILSGEQTLQVYLVTPGPAADHITFQEEVGSTLNTLDCKRLNPTTGSWTPLITGNP
jgi:hypothetical protein